MKNPRLKSIEGEEIAEEESKPKEQGEEIAYTNTTERNRTQELPQV